MIYLKKYWLRLDVLLFILCSVFFLVFNQVDLWVASLFYDPEKQMFFLKDAFFIKWVYVIFAKPQVVLLPLLIGASIYCFNKYRDGDRFKKWVFSFLLASLVCGPGILVNLVLKDNSIGRARPVHIQEFGGDKTFTPAFVYSGQCEKNCSFVSGHASIGFYLIGLGWLFRKRYMFWLGFALGAYVGMVRIVQGGHFLSDVVLAFWAVYFVNCGLAQLFALNVPRFHGLPLPSRFPRYAT